MLLLGYWVYLTLLSIMVKSGMKLYPSEEHIENRIKIYEVKGKDHSTGLGIKSFLMWLFYEK